MRVHKNIPHGIKAAVWTLMLTSCGLTQVSQVNQTNSDTTTDILTIGFVEPLHDDVATFIEALRGEGTVTGNQLSFIDQLIPVKVSNPVMFETTLPKTDTLDYGKTGNSVTTSYRTVDAGGRLLVMKKTGTDQSRRDVYSLFDAIPEQYLEGRTLEERTRYYLDAKYYEPKRIQNINEMLNATEFVFNFIPGYAGAEKVFYGSEDQRLWGVVQIVGDAATVGLGSKVMAVKKAAAGVVLTAASARVGKAAYETSRGTANLQTGIDAAIAMTEAGLAAFTLVKIKIGPLKGTVDSLSEARVLERSLERSADDILKHGLSPDEYRGLAGQLGRKLDDVRFENWKPRLESGAPVSKQGMASTGFLKTSSGDVFTQNSFTKHLVERGERTGMSRFGHTQSVDNAQSITASASLSPMDQLVLAIKIRHASRIADKYMLGAKQGVYQWGKMTVIDGVEVIMSPVGKSGPLPVLQHYRPLNGS